MRRHLRFACRAVQPFANVEHQLPAIAARQPLDETSRVADAVDVVAKRLQRSFNGLDRARLIELGGLLFAITGSAR